jgi:hypothetical protein
MVIPANIETIVQNYWVSGFCPFPGFLSTRKHNILETGVVSNLR